MSCTDYQTIIRQWFEDVMDTHISKCDSCAEFFRGLNQLTLNYLEQRRLHAMTYSKESPPPQPTTQQSAPLEIPQFPQELQRSLARLSNQPEIDPASPGLICNIGRFILDDRELEMLRGMTTEEPSELGLRVLTIKALEDLRGILNDITRHEDVIGWAILGSDGLMVAGVLPEEINAENLAVRALSVYMGTEDMLERIGTDKLQQIILWSEIGSVFVANFGEGIFITISSATQPEKVVRTLKKIRDVS
ncbi:MAG: roadblock/LC7 domain-containing protein [Candidatus Obscuribacterales bacterium]|nr:roadblock/LC7 domain-containing protein [Candidatus Obscuribacterales bacterium]